MRYELNFLKLSSESSELVMYIRTVTVDETKSKSFFVLHETVIVCTRVSFQAAALFTAI